jgi:arylsulfatase A-like enzyme
MKQYLQRVPGFIIAVLALLLLYRIFIAPSNEPYNLVLITIDTLRADHLGCYGYKRPTSPNIDALARRGTLFTHAYAPIPLTVPSHASMMTSLYPITHGIRANYHILDDSFTTLAEVLKTHGYATMAVTSAYCLEKKIGLSQGFDTYVDTEKKFQSLAGRVTGVTRDSVGNLGRPFFMWLHYFDPHGPYNPPPLYQNLFIPTNPQEIDALEKRRREILFNGGKPTEHELAKFIALYDSEIRYVDDEVGKFFELLKEKGLAKNTIIVITADHGEGFGHDYYFDHGDRLYEEEIHVPLIMAGPGRKIPGSRVISENVRLVDLMPTCLGLLRIPHEASSLEGVDLVPLITKRDRPRLKVFAEAFFRKKYVQAKNHMLSLKDGDWKLIVDAQPGRTIPPQPGELYNITRDPAETNNLAEEKRATASRMKDDIAAWVKRMRPTAHRAKNIYRQEEEAEREERLEKMRALGYVQ